MNPAAPVLWFCRRFLKWNRLEHIDLVELGSSLNDVIGQYGDPTESEPNDDFPEATLHPFHVGAFHQAVIAAWKGKACSITYWSSHSDAERDLVHMAKFYGKDKGWEEVEAGYWYVRKDGEVRLWCSAAPAIGVCTREYFEAKSNHEEVSK